MRSPIAVITCVVLEVEHIRDSYLDSRFDWSKSVVGGRFSHSGKPASLPQTDGSKFGPKAFAPANLPPTDLLAPLRIVLLLVPIITSWLASSV